MPLTKVTYSMVKNAPFNVLDYAGFAVTVSAKDQGDPASHLFTSFLSWKLPIQAALDACYAAGGGTVVLPKNTVPYYIDDAIIVKANTTFIFEDTIVLADYTTSGGSFSLSGNNITVNNIRLNNSSIYAGGSGQNGLGIGGGNQKVNGGFIINCSSGNNNDGTGDGGKGVQLEPGGDADVVVDGVYFDNCFMAMSEIRDGVAGTDYKGVLFTNITAVNCFILLFAAQTNVNDTTGLKATLQLDNFYARNCGAFEGVMQFSRASNISVSNGIVVNDPGAVATSLIRGNHRNCSFKNIGFYSNTNSIINLDPSTYAVDSSYAIENNSYVINHWGTVSYIADANIATPYRTLSNCTSSISLQNDVGSAFFGYELRNASSLFTVTQANKSVTLTTGIGALTSGITPTFANLSSGYNIPGYTNKFTVFATLPDTSVPNSSLFLNTATGKLSFKDAGGVVNALY